MKEWCVNNDIDFGLPEYKKTEKECYVYEMSVEQYLRCYEEFVKESICYVYNVYHYFEIIKKLNKSLSDEMYIPVKQHIRSEGTACCSGKTA